MTVFVFLLFQLLLFSVTSMNHVRILETSHDSNELVVRSNQMTLNTEIWILCFFYHADGWEFRTKRRTQMDIFRQKTSWM